MLGMVAPQGFSACWERPVALFALAGLGRYRCARECQAADRSWLSLLVTKNGSFLRQADTELHSVAVPARPGLAPRTDDFTSVLHILN